MSTHLTPHKVSAYLEQLSKDLLLVDAQCNICSSKGCFGVRPGPAVESRDYEEFVQRLNLRENVVCAVCSSSSRDRMLIYGLSVLRSQAGPLRAWKEQREVRLFESSGQRGHPPLLARKFDYYNTEYDPTKMIGEYDSRRYADLQKLPYEDGLFDICLSSDVFEHVRLHERGFSEVFRVLKQGGHFVMTVPYVHGWEKTLVKVEVRGDTDVFLSEPEYHDSHTLVYRIYGRDLLELLRDIGFSVGYFEGKVPAYAITHQNIVLCAKGSFLDLSGLASVKERHS